MKALKNFSFKRMAKMFYLLACFALIGLGIISYHNSEWSVLIICAYLLVDAGARALN